MPVLVHTQDGQTSHDNATGAFPDADGHLRILADSGDHTSVVAYYAANHWISVEISRSADAPLGSKDELKREIRMGARR